jgi:hypothetical protein
MRSTTRSADGGSGSQPQISSSLRQRLTSRRPFRLRMEVRSRVKKPCAFSCGVLPPPVGSRTSLLCLNALCRWCHPPLSALPRKSTTRSRHTPRPPHGRQIQAALRRCGVEKGGAIERLLGLCGRYRTPDLPPDQTRQTNLQRIQEDALPQVPDGYPGEWDDRLSLRTDRRKTERLPLISRERDR